MIRGEGDHPIYTEDPEMRQVAESLGTRWLEFFDSVHSPLQCLPSFVVNGIDDLMCSLALREAAVDHLASMNAVTEEAGDAC